jgi:hypothetical protein
MHPTSVALASIFALSLALGCTTREEAADERLTCEAGRQEASALLDARGSDPNRCSSHCDCVIALADIVCPAGATLLQCGRAIHRDSEDPFAALVREVADDVCPRVDPACFGGPGCTGVPACIDGTCTVADPSELDAGPPDAGAVDACGAAP